MYDAFLACSGLGARGEAAALRWGRGLKVGGPMQVWKRTVGKLPFVGVDEAVIAEPAVDTVVPSVVGECTPVEVLNP
ncbi:MAG: hypothetical protein R3E99_07555 [Burkholderiaceae bacterium]